MSDRIVIGDIHGSPLWKNILKREKPNQVIFLGDFFDSFDISIENQINNFKEIINYKRNNEFVDVILLIGNHDFHYLTGVNERYSGYSDETYYQVHDLLGELIDKGEMSMIYIDELNQSIYSHAGVSSKWLDNSAENNIELINSLAYKYFYFTYRDGGDWFGSSPYNSPLWVRPNGLLLNPYKDRDNKIWTQIYGHTNVEYPVITPMGNVNFYDIDCLNKGWYLVEELTWQNKISKRKLKNIFEIDDYKTML